MNYVINVPQATESDIKSGWRYNTKFLQIIVNKVNKLGESSIGMEEVEDVIITILEESLPKEGV